MQTVDIKIISVKDSSFKQMLSEVKPPPEILYMKGNTNLIAVGKKLGVVGSRSCTPYGREVTYDLSRKMAANDITIVSGLALGIDSIAHQAALDAGGKTIAVLPSDVTAIYPRAHSQLAETIVTRHGLLISEYADNPNPQRYQYIERNRLVAAICDVLLVTEAGFNSGALHTVRAAQSLNKTIAVVPGNITSSSSKGANRLFFEGAQPILEAADLLSLLGVTEKRDKPRYQPDNRVEQAILQLLANGPLTAKEMLLGARLDIDILNTTLTALELKDTVTYSAEGKWKMS